MKEQQIEAATRALHAGFNGPQGRTWDGTSSYWQQRYRDQAAAMLTAAHPVITSARELDALGFEAVVLDPCGTPATCLRSGPDFCEWSLGGDDYLIASETLLISGSSCTVLHPGDTE